MVKLYRISIYMKKGKNRMNMKMGISIAFTKGRLEKETL